MSPAKTCRGQGYPMLAILTAVAGSMLHPIVDMRSDTVTKPTSSMSAAMASAEVGDAVFGDDPTEARLEAKVAKMFGKEAALFVPTGTQGNLICCMAHCWERGSEFVVGNRAHIYLYEQGGAAQIGGIHPRALATADDGTFASLDELRGAIRPDDHHFPVTSLVTLENSESYYRIRTCAPAGQGASRAMSLRPSGCSCSVM